MSPTFARLGVPDSICRALAQRGIVQPFDIQTAVIVDALAGRDVCGRAPTGSGKTLAFGIPLVVNTGQAQPHRPRALVLAPTRELAEQITTELRSFSGKVRVAVVYGGVGYGKQRESLRRGVDILVACPGRLEDLIEQGEVRLTAVDRVVIDEADRMADMGFIPAVRRLIDQTEPERQTMLFSATLDEDVASLTRDYQHNSVRCEVGDETPDVISADHAFWRVARSERAEVTVGTIDAAGSSVVFCRTRHGCDRLARKLDRSGIATAAIHGGRSQNQRTRALKQFTTGRVQALIATDVAARGIHVEGVGAVIHYDVPGDYKTYLHRSGRTARAGRGGMVVSLVPPDQVKKLKRMQYQLDLQQPITEVDLTVIGPLDQSFGQPLGQPTIHSKPGGATTNTNHSNAGSRAQHQQPERTAAKPRRRRRRHNKPQQSRNHGRQTSQGQKSTSGRKSQGRKPTSGRKPASSRRPQGRKPTSGRGRR
ncbi:MAG: DEAD/DEAH box helicase [Acidimicrobiaceae bacterium]|nr:DEAD/DEAH box helicase [Acidimicrobiaceae bacterium]